METRPQTQPKEAPDRLFVHATGFVLFAGLAMIAGGYFAMDRALQHQGKTAQLALTTAEEAATVRSIVTGLDRLASEGDSADARPRRVRLAWEAERLLRSETDRLQTLSAEGGPETTSDIIELAERTRSIARSDSIDREAAKRTAEAIEADILPHLNLIATESRSTAEEARVSTRRVLFGSLAVQLVSALMLVLGVVQPARRRIVAWVARSDEADRKNRFRLLHDAVTGLPNATYLHAYLSRQVANSERNEAHTAVIRIDLDRFKILRETLGKRTCDEIIRICARRIMQGLRSGDFAAYLGQDDFVVVASDLEDVNMVSGIAARIQAALAKPISIRGGARRISSGIGVTLVSDDQPDAERILANANIALYEAQGAGPGNIRYFREDLRAEVERRETLYTEMLAGLDNGEFVPFFQPQIDLKTGGFAGFEALVRWHHPRHGLLTPAAFLDFADETDLAERIGEAVLSGTLSALRAWDAAGLDIPMVGVNFALAQLRDPRLIEKIKWETERCDIEPDRLAIEVLETVLIKSDQDLVVRNLRGLASAGFGIELDDFGTGHASISNLRRFMVNRIKIDRSFVFGIETSDEQQQLTASMIAMAQALGISTLAEGVETEDAEMILRRLECDYMQGFLIAKPMSLEETFTWLRGYNGRPYSEVPPQALEAGEPNTP